MVGLIAPSFYQVTSVPTSPIDGQKTGTSGLRKKVKHGNRYGEHTVTCTREGLDNPSANLRTCIWLISECEMVLLVRYHASIWINGWHMHGITHLGWLHSDLLLSVA